MLAKQRPLVKGHWRILQGVYRCWCAVARDMAGDGDGDGGYCGGDGDVTGEVDGDDNILVDYEVCVCVFW